jgi:RND family efflux transporter MFP subunit
VVDPSEHLFEVLDLTTVWVKIGVLEKDLHHIAAGQPVDLTLVAYPGEVFPTQIKSVGPALDEQTHLLTAWAEVANPSDRPPKFLPGMRGQARILLPSGPEKLRIPAAALIRDGAERFVLVEEAATKAGAAYRKRNVAVRSEAADGAEVEADLVPGDRVVTQGSHELAGFFVTGVLRLSAEAEKTIGLRVAPARPEVVEEVVQVDGAIELPPGRRALVSSRLPGTLWAICVDPGQIVSAGQVVAEVASLELQSVQLDYLRAHLEAGLSEEILTRLRSVSDRVVGRQLWEAESTSRSAQNRRQTFQEKLLALGLSSEQVSGILRDRKLVETLPLRAPIAGRVAQFDNVIGQGIKAEEPLLEIHDPRGAWVKGYVAERDLSRVRLGQPARVRFPAAPTIVATGKVVRQGGVVGADGRSLLICVEFDTAVTDLPQDLLARLSLTVRRPEPTLAVPLEAMAAEGTRRFVFVRGKDGVFVRREVTPGRADDLHVEITHGLRPGEQVAVRGTAELQTAFAAVR